MSLGDLGQRVAQMAQLLPVEIREVWRQPDLRWRRGREVLFGLLLPLFKLRQLLLQRRRAHPFGDRLH